MFREAFHLTIRCKLLYKKRFQNCYWGKNNNLFRDPHRR